MPTGTVRSPPANASAWPNGGHRGAAKDGRTVSTFHVGVVLHLYRAVEREPVLRAAGNDVCGETPAEPHLPVVGVEAVAPEAGHEQPLWPDVTCGLREQDRGRHQHDGRAGGRGRSPRPCDWRWQSQPGPVRQSGRIGLADRRFGGPASDGQPPRSRVAGKDVRRRLDQPLRLLAGRRVEAGRQVDRVKRGLAVNSHPHDAATWGRLCRLAQVESVRADGRDLVPSAVERQVGADRRRVAGVRGCAV